MEAVWPAQPNILPALRRKRLHGPQQGWGGVSVSPHPQHRGAQPGTWWSVDIWEFEVHVEPSLHSGSFCQMLARRRRVGLAPNLVPGFRRDGSLHFD